MKLFGFKTKEHPAKTPAPQSPKKEGAFIDIRITNPEGAVLYEGPLNGLKFPEKLIIAKCAYFFNDDEPCFIHRSAVAARLFEELNRLLEQKAKLNAAELQEASPGYLDEYPGFEYIEALGKTDT
ncbi:MAG: hypothetical protein LBC62_05220 [Treponema sp.]|jgi:hypothetical protein|nr:hypothetical protein [Treponema sp.]